jgi:hypothetical protein
MRPLTAKHWIIVVGGIVFLLVLNLFFGIGNRAGRQSPLYRLTPPGSGIGIYLVNPIAGQVTQICRLQGYGFDRWAHRKEAGSLH